MDSNIIQQNYQIIKNKINTYQKQTKITIIAVTKTHPQKVVQDAYKEHITEFGENKVQEAKKKFENLKFRNKIKLHLIGHLQTNKTKKAVELFDVIQTVDSLKIAEKINIEAQRIKKKQKIFVQINISNDKNKFGFLKNEAEKNINKIKEYKFLKPQGIMVITKQTNKEQEIKKYFKEAKQIQETIKNTIDSRYKFLSMGMSKDYMLGVLLGATHIRIGSSLFGERKI